MRVSVVFPGVQDLWATIRARDVHTREHVGMASKTTSAVGIRLPNKSLVALDEIIEREGVSRTEWIRSVLVPLIEAEAAVLPSGASAA